MFSFSIFRCEVPGCDTNDSSYDPYWLRWAIPSKSENNFYTPEKCALYQYTTDRSNDVDHGNSTCVPEAFDVNHKIMTCDKWVFGETDRTIVNDVS